MPAGKPSLVAHPGLDFVRTLESERFKKAGRDELVRVHEGIRETKNSLIRRAVLAGRDDVLATEVLGYKIRRGLHDRMLAHTARHREDLVLAFRGSGKTTMRTVVKSIGAVIRNRETTILIGSKKHGNSMDMLGEIKGHFESNEKLREIFGDFVGEYRWTEEAIDVAGVARKRVTPTINTVGVEGAVASKHYRIIFGDDLVEEENSATAYQRKRLQEWHDRVLDPCGLPPAAYPDDPECGQKHYNGTPYQIDDLWWHFLQTDMKERTLVIPIVKPNGTPVWPDRYPRDWIERKRRKVGTVIFASQWLCNYDPMKGSYFPLGDLHQVDAADFPSPHDVEIFMGVDLAIGDSKRADKFAIVVIGRVPQRWDDIWVWTFYEKQGLPFHKQTEKIIEFGKRYRPNRTAIESNAYQKAQFQEVRRQAPWLNAYPQITNKNKPIRAAKLSARTEAGNVHFVRGAHTDLIDHLVLFRGDDTSPDDLFDATDLAIHASEARTGRAMEPREEPGLI